MRTLEIQNLTVTYSGGVIAVADFSLCCNEGEGTVIAGAIGSGKSSILRAIAGLVPYEGKIIFDGRDLGGVPTRDRNFVYASYDSPLFGQRTVAFNLAYGMALRKYNRQFIDSRIKEVSSIFQIDNVLGVKAKTLDELSRRKLIIARSFTREADVYLFNDIAMGLDDEQSTPLIQTIQSQLAQKKAVTLQAISDYAQISDYNYKTALIRHGKMSSLGKSEYFKNCPPDVFAALFTNSNLTLTNGKIQNNHLILPQISIDLSQYTAATYSEASQEQELLIAFKTQQRFLAFCKESQKLLSIYQKE